jgi:hypothetical protein
VATVPGWAVWTLRLTVLLFAVLVLAQAVLAALFVTGDVGLLEAHGINAGAVATVAFLQVVAAILVWRPGRGAAWPIWASAALFLLVEAQLAFGYGRLLALHIPMGVALFGGATGLLVGVCSPRVRQVRARSGKAWP